MQQVPAASVELVQLDLAHPDSVQRLASRVLGRGEGLDLLVNKPDVMAVSRRQTTAQGFELQFGTNYLGHFALTGRLLPALLARPGGNGQQQRAPSASAPTRAMPHRAAVPRAAAGRGGISAQVLGLVTRFAAQPPRRERCRYCGPPPILKRTAATITGRWSRRGQSLTRKVAYAKSAHYEQLASRLWQASNELTGMTFPGPEQTAEPG